MLPIGKKFLGWTAKVKNGILFLWGLFGLVFFIIMLYAANQTFNSIKDIVNRIFYDTYLVIPEQHHGIMKRSFILYELIQHLIWYVLGYIIDLIHKPWWYILTMIIFISSIVYVITLYIGEDAVIQTEYEIVGANNNNHHKKNN